jgi:hypothetical protein
MRHCVAGLLEIVEASKQLPAAAAVLISQCPEAKAACAVLRLRRRPN